MAAPKPPAATGHAPKPPRTMAAGFTLLEVLMVMAVVGVLAALATPSMSAGLHRQQLVSAAESLATDVSEARLTAAQQGRVVSVQVKTLGADGPWCWTVGSAVQSDPCPGSGAQNMQHQGASHTSHPGVHMLHGQGVTLMPNGHAQAGTVAVFESAQGQRLRVDLLALGRSRICTLPNADGSTPGAGQLGAGALSRYARCA